MHYKGPEDKILDKEEKQDLSGAFLGFLAFIVLLIIAL